MRQKKFSEPFYNRFRKINLAGVIAPEEVNAYLDIYYRGLTELEKTLIYKSVVLAYQMDMGGELSRRYGFSMKYVFLLAELVLLEKMRMEEARYEIDSVEAAFRAVLRVFGNGLDDVRRAASRFPG